MHINIGHLTMISNLPNAHSMAKPHSIAWHHYHDRDHHHHIPCWRSKVRFLCIYWTRSKFYHYFNTIDLEDTDSNNRRGCMLLAVRVLRFLMYAFIADGVAGLGSCALLTLAKWASWMGCQCREPTVGETLTWKKLGISSRISPGEASATAIATHDNSNMKHAIKKCWPIDGT